MNKDPFEDVRDKRMNELNPEQYDRATELWFRNNFRYEDERVQKIAESLFRIIDRLRAPECQYAAPAAPAEQVAEDAARWRTLMHSPFLLLDLADGPPDTMERKIDAARRAQEAGNG